MWRTEERLEFWLAGGSPSEASRGRTALQSRPAWIEKLGLRRLAGKVNALPLGIEAGMISLDGALVTQATVQDALGVLGQFPDSARTMSVPGSALQESCPAAAATHSVPLLGKAVVRRLSIPSPERTRVRQERCSIQAATGFADVGIKCAILEGPDPMLGRDSAVQDGAGMLVPDPAVRTTSRVSELPHRRRSAEIGRFRDEDRNSYLREAEILKHVPPERAELVAVFHHVPIELISRLRFLAESREIRFSITNEPKRTQTRVHDMAVIRDTASREIHLVPHRTRCRVISLT